MSELDIKNLSKAQRDVLIDSLRTRRDIAIDWNDEDVIATIDGLLILLDENPEGPHE